MIVEEIPSSVRLRGFFEVLRVNFYDLKKIKNTSLQEAYYQVMINSYNDVIKLDELVEITEIGEAGKNWGTKKVNMCRKGSLIIIGINADKYSDGVAHLYDLQGKIVWKTRFNTVSGNIRKLNINSAGLSEGYYVLKVKTGKTEFKSGIVLTGR